MTATLPPRRPALQGPVEALLAQAAQLRAAGRLAESTSLMRRAAGLRPGSAEIQHDLGLTCLEVSDLGEAAAAFRRAIAIKPDFAQAHWRLGVALERQGDSAGAMAEYRMAIERLPSLADAQFRLGSLLEALGHRAEAIACFRRAKDTAGLARLRRLAEARALLAEDHAVDAERVLRRAVAVDPADPVAQDLLGAVLAEAGKFEEAAERYEQALAHAPNMVGSYYDLVRCRPVAAGETTMVERMRAALAQPGLGDVPVTKLHLAIGNALDSLGDYGLAMRAFDAADEVRRRTVGFDLRAFEARADRIVSLFTPSLLSRLGEVGCEDRTPVFVLGMPRSGTTLVEQMVSNHPDVAGGGELHFWNRRGALLEQSSGAELTAPGLRETAADYLRFIRGVSSSAARITDKMPYNFLWIGLIHLAFPRATIIHCRRSPIDTALSIHQTFFSPYIKFPTGGADLVAYHRVYRKLMAHWRAVLPKETLIEVDYELLTATPDAVARRIVAGIGLEWDEACLHPERNRRVVKTASKWQSRQPIYRTSVDRWRRYEPFLGPLAALIEA